MNIKAIGLKQRAFRLGALMITACVLVGMVGCEVDSWFNPSVVGRWERTPVTLPILSRMALIEPDTGQKLPLSPVEVEDLVPTFEEYRFQPNDTISIGIFELYAPGVNTEEVRRINEIGRIRLPVVGEMMVLNMTASELERHIAQILDDRGVLRDATVSVTLLDSVADTYTVYGEPVLGGTLIGTYNIPRPDYRLLDALAVARGVPGRTRTLYVYRRAKSLAEIERELRSRDLSAEELEATETAEGSDREEVVEDLIRQLDEAADGQGGVPENGDDWVYVDGKWVRSESAGHVPASELSIERLADLYAIRIIEIPYQQLLDGDVRYNVVIRPGDIIRVPPQQGGFVYLTGQINRPGAYTVPAERELTLTGVIAAAGGLGDLAIPERVDLRRRVGQDREAIVRFNLRAVYDGTEPNFYLKPNDEINIGTNFFAVPLAVFRNGFRMTYGFGFILDRNFSSDVF